MRLQDAAKVLAISTTLLIGVRSTLADPPVESDKKFVPMAIGMDVPVITSAADLDKHVGKLVAVRGSIDNTKPPTIVGVWVDTPSALRHKEGEAYAIGILCKSTMTEAKYREAQEEARRAGNLVGVAIPTPGNYYQLFADLTGKLAEPKPVPKTKGK